MLSNLFQTLQGHCIKNHCEIGALLTHLVYNNAMIIKYDLTNGTSNMINKIDK